MHILIVGFNHKTAPVELRERLSFARDRLQMALRSLRGMRSILECVLISTCNRMELYVVCDQLHTGEYHCKAFLESWFRIPREEFADHLYVRQDQEAVRHLFQVVCGLDSLVLGETQILGQVKEAFLLAQATETTGTLFHMLFRQAITLGKWVHAETEMGQNAVSVSYAAVELGRKMFHSFAGKTILLIGAGKMAELTAKHFHSIGATQVLVLNRTFAKAEEMAARFNGEARPWEQLVSSFGEADIVVSSTGANEPILTRSAVEPVLKRRRSPLFIIDIAVPRDIDPAIHALHQVYLYNIDDLSGIVAANLRLREQEAQKVQARIEQETIQFAEWLHTLGVVPLLAALREKAVAIQAEAMARMERKLPHLTEQEKRVLRKYSKSMVNQLLRDPIVRVKELAASSHKEEAFALFVHLFALEEQMSEQKTAVAFQPTFFREKVFDRP
jgi:glutamyl-tRNA reductase